MPRGQASKPLSQDQELQKPSQPRAQQTDDDHMMARFTGEASLLISFLLHSGAQQGDDGVGKGDGNGHDDAAGDGNIDVEMTGDGHHGADATLHQASNETPAAVRAPKRKRADVEEVPINLNELRLLQLKEDRDAYQHDMQWCQDVLDQEDITPTETRTFQLRLMDLGHQLRMVNHTIAQIESEMQNLRFFGAGPPSSTRPSFMPGNNNRAYFMDAEPPQERRGPGRPPGSKNRPKDASATPQPPSSNAQKAAAALASAGAKRILPTEIRVATPDGRAPGPGVSDNANKRLCINVGSPVGSATEDDNDAKGTANASANGHADTANEVDEVVKVEVAQAANATSGRRTARTRDTTKEEDRSQKLISPTAVNNKKNINASSAAGAASVTTPSASTSSLPTRNSSSSKKSTGQSATSGGGDPTTDNDDTEPETPAAGHNSEPDPTGPGGSRYQRLGYHRCQLCTSQKYLTQTTPKQPSEPSSWPLRDVSKMVTHYTRMHGEHNKMERCMELGRALEDNRGPFRYWLAETKRVRVPLDQIDDALRVLHQGRLPDLLRRYSNAARGFPKD
ncbi:hypothetical protein VPNG_07261 [Cytospora leucostoma]|uniref:Uncharacterized protein n=1 Tax=Cytospora leucostoma TaxID=1230097 RepID=A0A423WKI7_9PEZI|nr:hypothetical protein VPNG_07261 [Cytospora leucostoma]